MKPRITILPSLRLGGHNNPNPYPLRLPRLSGESNALRRGITGKSPWKSAAPQQTESKLSFAFGLHDNQGIRDPSESRGEIPYATELRLFVFAPLTSIRKTILFWFLLGLFMRASPKSLPLCYMIVTNWATHKMKSQITISTQRYRVFIFLRVSVPLCCIYIW